jgi:hypothetical protein
VAVCLGHVGMGGGGRGARRVVKTSWSTFGRRENKYNQVRLSGQIRAKQDRLVTLP